MKPIILYTCGRFSGPLNAIGGYAYNLIEGLRRIGCEAAMLDSFEEPKAAQAYLKDTCEKYQKAGKTPIVHIQLTHPWCNNPYDPSFISGFSFPVVVTCQELRRMAELDGVVGVDGSDGEKIQREIIAVLRAADRVIFIDRNELALAEELEQKFYPASPQIIAAKSSVIEPVPGGVKVLSPPTNQVSVIEPVPGGVKVLSPPTNQVPDILHFGMFRYGKGLDRIGEFAKLFRDDQKRDRSAKMHIIGAVGLHQESYLYELLQATHGLDINELQKMSLENIISLLKKRYADHPIQYHINLPEGEASALMATTQYAVFLFPEGATRYGSSIPAAIAHGLVPIVSYGKDTPYEFTRHQREEFGKIIPNTYTDGAAVVLENDTLVASKAYEAYRALAVNPELGARIRVLGKPYTEARLPENVALSHMRVYSGLKTASVLGLVVNHDVHRIPSSLFWTLTDTPTCASNKTVTPLY